MPPIPEPVPAGLPQAGWRRLAPTLGLAVAHVLCWRFELLVPAMIVDGLLLVWLLLLWIGRRHAWASTPLAAALLALALMTTLLGLDERLWPCSIGCSNGAYYQELWGMDLLLPAALSYAAALILCLGRIRSATPPRAASALIWLLIGCSAFFLLLSWRLEMLCSHCLAVHGIVLLLLPCVWPGRLPAAQGLGLALLAGLGLHALYHPDIVDADALEEPARQQPERSQAIADFFADSSPDGTVLGPDAGLRLPLPQQLQLLDAADRGRSFGHAQAPWRLELVYRFECSHCAAHMHEFWQAMQPLIAAGHLQLRFIASVDTRDPASQDRGRLVLAAASQGRFLPVCMALLGAEGIDSPAGNRDRLAQLPDAARIAAVTAQYQALWTRMLEEDRQRAAIGRGRTPRVHLLHHGLERASWTGVDDIPALVTAIRAELDSAQQQ